MKNQTIQLVWLFVEIFAILRSAVASFNVVMNVSGGDVTFAVFTTATIELALFAMLLMAGSESVAPIAALCLIVFSAILQYCEIALMQGSMDPQSKQILTYAVSFSPSVLLLFGLVKRLTDGGNIGGVLSSLRGLFEHNAQGKPTKEYGFTVPALGKRWVEKNVRWRDANGKKHSRSLTRAKRNGK